MLRVSVIAAGIGALYFGASGWLRNP